MEIEEARFDNLIVLRPSGRLDNGTSPEFQTRLLQMTASATADLIIDFAQVGYISSGGLRALVMAAKHKPADHRLGVTGLHALVQEVFSIAHFEEVLPVFATIEEARRAWRDPPGDPASRGAG